MLQRLRALLVDDDESDYLLTREVVGEIDHGSVDLCWAVDRNAMLSHLANRQFDVVLMDYYLGEYTGIDLIEELQQQYPFLPVILFMGQGSRQINLDAMASGAVDYLYKNEVTSQELERTMRYAVERTRLQQRAHDANYRYRLLVEHANDGVIAVDASRRITFANPAFCRLVGYPLIDVLDRPTTDFVHPDDIAHVSRYVEERFNGNTPPMQYEHRILTRDGEVRHVEVNVTTQLADGIVIGTQAILRDITERKVAAASLHDSEERYRRAFDDAAIAMAMASPEGQLLRVNQPFCALLGYTEEELLNLTRTDITHPDDLQLSADYTRALHAGERASYQVEKRYRGKHGGTIWGLLNIAVVRDRNGQPLYEIIQIQDLTQRKRLETELAHQAFHDSLTGLPNRALFHDRLSQALVASARSNNKVGLLFIDLDNFKGINDRFGHQAGDELLIDVAQRLASCLRNEDTVSRLGGDEFVVLVTDAQNDAGMREIVKRILKSMQRPHVIADHDIQIELSFGIAISQRATDTPEDLLRWADIAMYRAKRQGKNGYAFFDPTLSAAEHERVRREQDLRRAIEVGQLVLHYQPLIALADGAMSGIEALVRWQDPARGLVYPADFIGLAEETGLIVSLGEWVLAEACRQFHVWQQAGIVSESMRLSVNLSGKQFNQPDLVDRTAAIMKSAGVRPEHIVLEITETATMDDVERTINVLHAFKGLGVQIAIDDFGMQHSSLARLSEFPADYLKIDRHFVAGLDDDLQSTVIVSGIIALAHALGLQVVAEGVETEQQATRLRERQCEIAQGYVFSRPLTPEQLEIFAGSRQRLQPVVFRPADHVPTRMSNAASS